jgi:hypothetical protein
VPTWWYVCIYAELDESVAGLTWDRLLGIARSNAAEYIQSLLENFQACRKIFLMHFDHHKSKAF